MAVGAVASELLSTSVPRKQVFIGKFRSRSSDKPAVSPHSCGPLH